MKLKKSLSKIRLKTFLIVSIKYINIGKIRNIFDKFEQNPNID